MRNTLIFSLIRSVRNFDSRDYRAPESKDSVDLDSALIEGIKAIASGHYYRSIVGNDKAREKAMAHCKEK